MVQLLPTDAPFLESVVSLATEDTVRTIVRFAVGYAQLRPTERSMMERLLRDLFEKFRGRQPDDHELKHFVHSPRCAGS